MTEFGEKPVDRVLRSTAIHYFRDIPNVVLGLLLISENPEPFQKRVILFDEVLNHLNFLRREAVWEPIDPDYYRDVIELNRVLGDQPLPALKELVGLCEAQGNLIEKVFTEIKRKVARKKWKFPTQVKDPNLLASGFLIEGYGLFAERYFRKRGLAKTCVLGFEAALLAQARYAEENPPIDLFEDILPWMLEEKDNFPPSVKQELENL